MLIKFVFVFYISLPVIYAQVVTTPCPKYHWQCRNGQCIHQSQLCDGAVHCRDRSDEMASSCNQNICQAYAFRCTYGACVAGLAECNGIKDCFDNSDEDTINCPRVPEDYSGNCTKPQFQCTSGHCINPLDICDGILNCPDGSDETERVCINVYCPEFGFKCDYGGCINGDARCDRKKDCVDASDESYDLCGYNITFVPVNESPDTNHPTVITVPPNIPNRTPPPGTCFVPEAPENGRIVYSADPSVELRQGQYIGEGEPIEYKCYSKYVLVGNAINYCFDSLWLDKTPKCRKYCDPLPLNKISINAVCEYNGKGISCQQALPPGTRVSLSCQIGYRRPDRPLPDVIICDSSGEWHSHPWKCDEDCGVPSPDIIPFVVGGEFTEIRKVPWHSGIYGFSKGQNKYVFLCGGTIVSSRIVVSAAHCFWNVLSNTFNDRSLFNVAVGKSLREYDAVEEYPAQFFNISELIVKREYNHEDGLFFQDIAVLVLSDFIKFRPYILPVCIDFKLIGNDQYIPSDWQGMVAGWGRTQSGGELSNDLKVLRLPSVDYYTCRNASPVSYRKFITGDKFCAGHLTGESVCQGDSGGGLVFPRIIDEMETYFLYGVVSSGPAKENSCDNTKYSLFTNIYQYITLIREHYLMYLAL